MEFRTPIDDRFLIRNIHENILSPLALIEYTVTFLRLYRKITDNTFGRSNYEAKVILQNIHGFILRPGKSGPYEFEFGDDNSFTKKTLLTKKIDLPNDFEPDFYAYKLLGYVYSEFRIEVEIPYYNENENIFKFD